MATLKVREPLAPVQHHEAYDMSRPRHQLLVKMTQVIKPTESEPAPTVIGVLNWLLTVGSATFDCRCARK
jgi:hypothetical protein